MKLYKEYKEELQQRQKEAQDRAKASLPDQVAIIYEETGALQKLRDVGKILVFAGMLGLSGAAVIWILSLMGGY